MKDSKLKVLLVTGKVTLEHDYRKVNELLRTLLTSTGRFEVFLMEEFRNITEELLEPYDVLLVNYDGKNWPTDKAQRFGERTEQAVYNFVAKGKGIVFYHSSVWVDADWPLEYVKLMGGCCSMEKGSRRFPKGDFEVKMTDDTHPITEGIEETWLTVEDDLFAGVFWHPESKVKVLASVYDDINVYKKANFPPKHHPVNIPEGKLENMYGVNTYLPVAWVNEYGKGRSFTITLGHGEGTIHRFSFITMLVRGVEWAASGKVTLNAPDRSGDNRLKPWPYY